MANAGQRHLGFVVAGLMLGILTAAMDNTIVATAMGTIVADMGGLDKFVWVTSAYMVAEMAGMPIFGKLSDMYGRKRFFVFGMIVFLIGSVLCGTAQSIEQLSMYRAIQGIGGGALMPIAFTIIFDVFPPEKRGQISGLFGAVFGMSSIFGPLLGAYITDYISWHWIFYINLPIGLLSLGCIMFFYKESLIHARQKIDWLGAAALVGAIVCLMFGLELGGHTYAWDSAQIIGLFGGFVVLFAAFVLIERRAEEPIISFDMFRSKLYAGSNLVGLFFGIAFIVATVYIPIFIQGVYGGSATNSGLILLPMMLGTVVTAQVGGFLAGSGKMSYRGVMIAFSLLFIVSMALLATISAATPRWLLTVYMILVGLGVGASFSTLGMAAMHPFDETRRGSASSTMSFVRTLGMTLGITIYGLIQRNAFAARMGESFGAGSGTPGGGLSSDPRALLSPEARAAIPAPVLETITGALSASITHAFMWAVVPAALAFVFSLTMGADRMKPQPRAAAKAE
ncbi:drug resistance transporter, EmrB/QacA subfamily [Paenibacillus sp. UNCCL117]|uniref:MDR family MFS transporter n=1 Tax=unclassified Paenibacillus TaxID=185978 RepID=UPI00088D9912|nr:MULTISPECIES: MDR family MFS transporter [unclassified Paenibacillus]SDD00640.1 drug resistance transporter, EmrB/QacA subfamily [Paenibacillus sp. cl123]SFW32826.1 drug resistance transporter, EmrB/QacA subfamily [Paenibacillus sp. UNCCL117]